MLMPQLLLLLVLLLQRVELRGSSFASPPWRFEAGTLPFAQIVGAAVDFLQDVGLSNVRV